MSAPSLGGRLTVPDVEALAAAYCAKPGNEAGGRLHIVLSDGNLHRAHIESCRNAAVEARDADGVALADGLLTLSMSQIRRLYRRSHY